MSAGKSILQPDEGDMSKILAANAHIGSPNVNHQMEQYAYKMRADGTHIINVKKMWEKLLMAARAIVAIENPADVFVISSRPMGQRAVLKFAHYTGATPIAGRFTPGAFTNQIQAKFREPRLLVVTDPRADHQPINEASFVNLPVIAFCNTDSSMRFIDIAIPCNNKGVHSIGLMWWMLCREVRRMRGITPRSTSWEEEVMPDLFFFRDAEEEDKKKTTKIDEVKAIELPMETTEEVPMGTETGIIDANQSLTAAPEEKVIEDMSAQTGNQDNWGAGAVDNWG